MSKNIIEVPSSKAQQEELLVNVWIGSGVFLFLLVIIFFIRMPASKKKPGKLGRLRFATNDEIKASALKVIADIQSGKDVTTWLGNPKGFKYDIETGAIALPYSPKTTYLGSLAEHVAIVAKTGCGKNYSISDPMARNLIRRGQPLIVLDLKGHEEQYAKDDIPVGIEFSGSYGKKIAPSSYLAGFALMHGYEVYPIAPGYLDSDRINLYDSIKSPTDATNAFTISKIVRDNLMGGKKSGEDGFFDESANLLIQALFMYVKSLDRRVHDLVMAHEILNLPWLINALDKVELPPYVRTQFAQFLRTKSAKETADSIAGTAAIAYSRFVTPDLTAVFSGLSNVPMQLSGKQMVIYRLNVKELHAVGPLVGALLSLQIDANIFTAREDPILFFLDELARVKLNELRDRMDVARSNQGCFILMGQSFESFDQKWGKGMGETIMAGANTQIVGKSTGRTAKFYADEFLGKEDVHLLNKTKSRGGKSGSSRGKNESTQAVNLIQQAEFGSFGKGQFLISSPSIQAAERVNMPVKTKIHIPESEKAELAQAEANWRKWRKWKIATNDTRPMTDQALRNRATYARRLFPDPAVTEEKNARNSF